MREKAHALTELKREMEACNKCSQLTKGCGAIFDNGNPDADLMIIAEAAGADEEKLCLPLIGRCGKLIEEMIQHIGLTREDTWRANVCACRPPGNRDPQPDEIENCRYFLLKQLEIVQPKMIVLLGKFAAQTFLGSAEPIGKLRGFWHCEGSDEEAYVLYHPSYILRNGNNLIEEYKAEFKNIQTALVV